MVQLDLREQIRVAVMQSYPRHPDRVCWTLSPDPGRHEA
jgi:hypothetical protein